MGIQPTCIDHIITNSSSIVHCSGIIEYNISHHLPIFVTLDINNNTGTNIGKPKLQINEFTLNGFANDIKNIKDDITLITNGTAEDCFAAFHTKFETAYDKWFVNSRRTENKKHTNLRKDWITVGLAKSCTNKNKLYGIWRRERTCRNWNNYISYKRKLDKLLAKAKFDYYNKKFQENQSTKNSSLSLHSLSSLHFHFSQPALRFGQTGR